MFKDYFISKKMKTINIVPFTSRSDLKRRIDKKTHEDWGREIKDISQKIQWLEGESHMIGKGFGFLFYKNCHISLVDIVNFANRSNKKKEI